MKTYNDTREAIFEELYKITLDDPDVVVLTTDTGALKFKDFARDMPDRWYNVGIAEQNAMTVAAGLTKIGKKVFVFGISNFVVLRCFEQLRVDVCGMNCPVVVLGMGAGYTYAQDGLTHHMTEDIAAVNSLPNITIWSPSDYTLTANLIHMAYKTPTPCYIRFDKGPFNPIYSTVVPRSTFDRGQLLHGNNKDVTIVATGISVKWALEIATDLNKSGILTGVIDLFRIKPLNREILGNGLERTKLVVTIEEHNVCGGIGTMIGDVMAEREVHRPLKKFAIPDTFRSEVGDREFLRKLNGMDHKTVVETIEKMV